MTAKAELRFPAIKMREWKPAGVHKAIAWGAAVARAIPCGTFLVIAALMPGPAAAQSAEPETLPVQIPAQPLAQALEDFAHVTGLQIVYLASEVGEQKTQEIPAGMSAADALTRLLQGTG